MGVHALRSMSVLTLPDTRITDALVLRLLDITHLERSLPPSASHHHSRFCGHFLWGPFMEDEGEQGYVHRPWEIDRKETEGEYLM